MCITILHLKHFFGQEKKMFISVKQKQCTVCAYLLKESATIFPESSSFCSLQEKEERAQRIIQMPIFPKQLLSTL